MLLLWECSASHRGLPLGQMNHSNRTAYPFAPSGRHLDGRSELKRPPTAVDAPRRAQFALFLQKVSMNGRCENDPFDQARNVCGLCYGEFCPNCLLDVKGRKHPLCKECAVISSGIRGGSKQAIRGPKRTADARRKALAEAPEQAHGQFATTEAGTKLDAIQQAQIEADLEAATKSKKRGRKSAGTQSGGNEKPPPPQTVKQTTAADLSLIHI